MNKEQVDKKKDTLFSHGIAVCLLKKDPPNKRYKHFVEQEIRLI